LILAMNAGDLNLPASTLQENHWFRMHSGMLWSMAPMSRHSMSKHVSTHLSGYSRSQGQWSHVYESIGRHSQEYPNV
jgi:formate dehydrogenase assembly factor FdhD